MMLMMDETWAAHPRAYGTKLKLPIEPPNFPCSASSKANQPLLVSATNFRSVSGRVCWLECYNSIALVRYTGYGSGYWITEPKLNRFFNVSPHQGFKPLRKKYNLTVLSYIQHTILHHQRASLHNPLYRDIDRRFARFLSLVVIGLFHCHSLTRQCNCICPV
jgi:hypothetical protein